MLKTTPNPMFETELDADFRPIVSRLKTQVKARLVELSLIMDTCPAPAFNGFVYQQLTHQGLFYIVVEGDFLHRSGKMKTAEFVVRFDFEMTFIAGAPYRRAQLINHRIEDVTGRVTRDREDFRKVVEISTNEDA